MADNRAQPRPDGDIEDAWAELDPRARAELYDGVLGRRIVAFCVDFALVCAMTLAAYVVLLIAGVLTLGLAWLLLGLAFPVIALTYSAVTLGGPRSATIGMRLVELETRLWYGAPMTAILGAFHTLVFYFSVSVLTPLVLLVPLFNRQRRCLHDFLCGTVIVNTPERVRSQRI